MPNGSATLARPAGISALRERASIGSQRPAKTGANPVWSTRLAWLPARSKPACEPDQVFVGEEGNRPMADLIRRGRERALLTRRGHSACLRFQPEAKL